MVHRPPAVMRDHRRATWIAIAIIAALELAWLGWFLHEPLPNAANVGGRNATRANILWRAFPGVVPGVRLRESYLGLALDELGHVENLPQRVPILLVAGLIGAAAVAAGGLILRGLRLRAKLDGWERLALAYGLGTTTLGCVTLIAGRWGLLHPISAWAGLVAVIAAGVAVRLREGFKAGPMARPRIGPALGMAAVVGPFLALMALAAMLPTIDFDAIEYHLQGPKEYYQAGRIRFLPHNVYTSMPFGIEMLHLLGMEVFDDWWRGALAGQLMIAAFAPASAILIYATASRLGSPRAGWVAAVAYLTAPWVYRLAVLPYVEGPLCFFHAALAWAVARSWDDREDGADARWGWLLGLLAGGAMAIKYPALLSAVAPFGLAALARSWRDRSPRFALRFAAGTAIVMAPWLIKNVVDTGNPVYPLGYGVFGGSHWDPAADAKWRAVHGPRPIVAAEFFRSIVDVAGRSDWQTPLFAALAPLAFLRRDRWRGAGWLAAYAAYLFLSWWLLTHRLDRFWLPMLPALAVLAGLGADWTRGRIWTAGLAALLSVAIVANLAYTSTALAGLNEWTGDLQTLRRTVPEMTNPGLAELDARLPPGAKPLLVGQAAVFHFNRPVVYNTVFDDETIETLAKGKTPEEVRRGLERLGVTHVYVDWSEIGRYRSPGNYGFTPFVTPELFAGLVRAGVLGPPSPVGGPKHELYEVRKGTP
ncbi:ArnT family glycosyltransferase [Tundrisphaera sp. TA3]|uniref:ArnT family glycosyltransferase n=1 Tax=Tundrisphaera sp. TA3 TaxID=3435775 RepID=UPI003EBD001D